MTKRTQYTARLDTEECIVEYVQGQSTEKRHFLFSDALFRYYPHALREKNASLVDVGLAAIKARDRLKSALLEIDVEFADAIARVEGQSPQVNRENEENEEPLESNGRASNDEIEADPLGGGGFSVD